MLVQCISLDVLPCHLSYAATSTSSSSRQCTRKLSKKYRNQPSSSPHTSQSRLVVVMYLRNFLLSHKHHNLAIQHDSSACNQERSRTRTMRCKYMAPKRERVPQAHSVLLFKPMNTIQRFLCNRWRIQCRPNSLRSEVKEN